MVSCSAAPGVSAARFSMARLGKAARNVARLIEATLQRRKGVICDRELIPEFKSLDRGHNSPFHRFAMDEHTFRFVAALTSDPFVAEKISGEVVVAALLHDIGKPASETIKPDGQSQYLQHDKKGAEEVAPPILDRLEIEGEARETILALVGKHMAPVQVITQSVSSEGLNDKALGRFVRDVVEPLAQKGVDLDLLFAFGRADLIASQGPECYTRLGVPEGDEAALIAKIDQSIASLKGRIAAYYDVQKAKAANKPALVNGDDLIVFGIPKGPTFGKALARAAALEREGLNKEQIIVRLRAEFQLTPVA